ncbi:MAG: J domain-containing protein, partial [Candidatus Micrarchaeota archaeon]
FVKFIDKLSFGGGATQEDEYRHSKCRTHYDTLGVAQDAPFEVIKAAYKAMSIKYHPDTNSEDPKASERMKQINAAYEILSDPVKRAKYDTEVKSQNFKEEKYEAKSESRGKRKNEYRPSKLGVSGTQLKLWCLGVVATVIVILLFGHTGGQEQQNNASQPQPEAAKHNKSDEQKAQEAAQTQQLEREQLQARRQGEIKCACFTNSDGTCEACPEQKAQEMSAIIDRSDVAENKIQEVIVKKQNCQPYTTADGTQSGTACKQKDGTWKIKTIDSISQLR